MSWVFRFLLALFLCMPGPLYAAANMVYDVFGDRWEMKSDTIIMGSVYVDTIDIVQSVELTNNGDINADITICDACRVMLTNSGTMSGRISIDGRGRLTQVITSPDDIRPIPIDGGYDIVVRNVRGLNLSDIMTIANGARKITLDNTDIIFDTAYADEFPTLELAGEVWFDIVNPSVLTDGPIVSNITGLGRVSTFMENPNPLYAFTTYIENGNLYVRSVRETDYAKIMDNDVGWFLNMLRRMYPNDKLLWALDNATTMDEVDNIMSRSYRFHPIILTRPVDVIDNFVMLSDVPHTPVWGAPMYIFSDDFNIRGVRGGINMGSPHGFMIGISGYGADMEYSDVLNDFRSEIYGGAISASYSMFDFAFIRAMVGHSVARFDCGPIFNNGDVVYNPIGRSIYGMADLGFKYNFETGFYVAPFIGAVSRRTYVVDDTQNNFDPRVGADIGYSFAVMGLRYDYSVRGVTAAHMGRGAEFEMSAYSVFDGAGGYARAGIMHDEYFTSYKFEIGAKFEF